MWKATMSQHQRKKRWKYSLDLEPILAMNIAFQFLLSVAANEMGKCVQTEWFCSFICLSCALTLFLSPFAALSRTSFHIFRIPKLDVHCECMRLCVCMCQYGRVFAVVFPFYIFSGHHFFPFSMQGTVIVAGKCLVTWLLAKDIRNKNNIFCDLWAMFN